MGQCAVIAKRFRETMTRFKTFSDGHYLSWWLLRRCKMPLDTFRHFRETLRRFVVGSDSVIWVTHSVNKLTTTLCGYKFFLNLKFHSCFISGDWLQDGAVPAVICHQWTHSQQRPESLHLDGSVCKQLSPGAAGEIRLWLAAHAAQHWQTVRGAPGLFVNDTHCTLDISWLIF